MRSERRTPAWWMWWSRGRSGMGIGVLAAVASGCDVPQELAGSEAPAALALARGVASEVAWSEIPVPAADGPKLAALSMKTPVFPEPDRSAEPVGYLRVGARVARSQQPVSHKDCPSGWYAVRPLGFVCSGTEATTDLDNPLARAVGVEPDRALPMPYKYAFVRATAPNYLRVPTVEEQERYEMGLERHLRNYEKLRDAWDALDVGANDMPLDERGVALGQIPDHARPLDMDERFGGRTGAGVPWWLDGGRKIPNLSSFAASNFAVIASRVKRHAGVALVGTFAAGEAAGQRRFAISTDLRLLPADKLKADSGSPFHGELVERSGLPVAWVYSDRASSFRVEGGTLVAVRKLRFREYLPLNGKVRTVGGTRVVQTTSGDWVKSEELRTAVKPRELPGWARNKTRWMDISLLQQTLVLWEGSSPIYATLISSGRDGLGEPGKTLSTPQGVFRIYQKHVTATMDSDVADHEFELRDVPWVMYFKGGYALHGAYWHDDFGRARSHGCVNLSPIDARFAFRWSLPNVPEHWHAAYNGDAFGPGVTVRIGP